MKRNNLFVCCKHFYIPLIDSLKTYVLTLSITALEISLFINGLWFDLRHLYFKGALLWLFICCKTKLKKKNIFEKIFVIFTKYTLFAEKNVFIWIKSFILKYFFTEKNFCYREKYKWKCKRYISHLKNTFLYRKCLCYKQNINLC